jgi:hypothetical protein
MAILIAALGEGKGTWQTVFKLASMSEWEKVIFVGPAFAGENLELKENMKFVAVDEKQPIGTLIAQLQKEFGTIFGEVGVNLTSGSGNLHMAILSAILKSGGGVKLVTWTDKFEEI